MWMDLIKFVVKKIFRLLILLFLVSVATFFLLDSSPIDPLQSNVGQATLSTLSQEQIQNLEEYWGTNLPMSERFVSWFTSAISGDMGISLIYRQPVIDIINEKVLNSLGLMVTAWALSGVIGLTLGVVAALNKNKTIDNIISGYILIVSSTPVFWVGLILLMIFSVWLGIFPIGFSVPIGYTIEDVSFWDRIVHGFLPALTLSVTGLSHITLHTREKMISVLQSDYVLFAKARGESMKRIVFSHGLRNIMLPAISVHFATISEIFGGSILVEQIFSYPGLGNAAIEAGLGSDIPLLMGITIISAFIVFMGNAIADVIYGFVDPRMRKRGGKL